MIHAEVSIDKIIYCWEAQNNSMAEYKNGVGENKWNYMRHLLITGQMMDGYIGDSQCISSLMCKFDIQQMWTIRIMHLEDLQLLKGMQ